MRDKQIMINSVDVSGCKFFNDITESYYCFGIPCKDRPNCDFKQLARKTQECEELKERLVRTEEDLKYQCVDCMNVKSDRYREALEEIEKVINNILNSCLGRNTVSCRPAHNVCGDLINILDIIKKIKESE